MHRTCNYLMGILMCLLLSFHVHAQKSKKEPLTVTIKAANNVKPLAKHEAWYLSGIVETEARKKYGYYFIVFRDGDKFYHQANVMDLVSREQVLSTKSQAELPLKGRLGVHFLIGDAFLRYNDINHSWTFGIDKAQGLNLRLESLDKGNHPVNHYKDWSFSTEQSMRVNGELSIEGKNQFVIGSNTWLVHEWGNKLNRETTFERLLCRLKDGRGLMVFRAYEQKKIAFDLATLLEASGKDRPVSQFSAITQTTPKAWRVSLLSPRMELEINTLTPESIKRDGDTMLLYPGSLKNNRYGIGGYCLITTDDRNQVL